MQIEKVKGYCSVASINQLHYLEGRPHQPKLVFKLVFYIWVELEFGDAGYSGVRKTAEPGEKPSEQHENQQQTQPHMAQSKN